MWVKQNIKVATNFVINYTNRNQDSVNVKFGEENDAGHVGLLESDIFIIPF